MLPAWGKDYCRTYHLHRQPSAHPPLMLQMTCCGGCCGRDTQGAQVQARRLSRVTTAVVAFLPRAESLLDELG
jgi:hypothetical protein